MRRDRLREHGHAGLRHGVRVDRKGLGGLQAEDRTDVDDRAATLALHVRDHRPGEAEDALEEHVHHAVPDRIGRLVQRAGVQQASGVVDEHVDAPERRERRLHGVLNVALVGDTARHGQRVATHGGDRVGDLTEDLFAAASDRYLGSFTRERRGNGGADAGSATGHNGYFVCESHGSLPLRPDWPSARVCVSWLRRRSPHGDGTRCS